MGKLIVQIIPPLNIYMKTDTIEADIENEINIKYFEKILIEELLPDKPDDLRKRIKFLLDYVSYEIEGVVITGKEGILKEGQTIKLYLSEIGG